jgi:hypothetical protein
MTITTIITTAGAAAAASTAVSIGAGDPPFALCSRFSCFSLLHAASNKAVASTAF